MARPKRKSAKIVHPPAAGNSHNNSPAAQKGKRKATVSNEDETSSSTVGVSKRARKPLSPYQSPESITSILKAVTSSSTSKEKKKPLAPARKSNERKSESKVTKTKPEGSKPASNKRLTKPSNNVKKAKDSIIPSKIKDNKRTKKTKRDSVVKAVLKKVSRAKKTTQIIASKKLIKNVISPPKEPEEKPKKAEKGKRKASPKKEEKAKKPKRGRNALNPKPDVTLYEQDPTVASNLPIPHISTISHSRLVIRGVIQNDLAFLKKITTKDVNLITSICFPRAPYVDRNAFDYAVELGNFEALKILASVNPKDCEKRFGPIPDLMVEDESTGRGSRMMFGHALRSVTVGRGGKEGNAALLKDSQCYREYSIPRVPHSYQQLIQRMITRGVPYKHFEELPKLLGSELSEGDVWRHLSSNLSLAAKQGHHELAGKIVSLAIERGGSGFNFLHGEALNLKDNKPFSPFKPVSVIKKCYEHPRMSPLHFAAINPNPFYLQTLLNATSEMNLNDQTNWTPVHYAAVCSSDGPLKTLLNRGATFITPDKEGNTPLHLACSRGRLHNVKLLLETEKSNAAVENEAEEAPINKSSNSLATKYNKKGMRPIHLAAFEGHVEIVKVLLDAGDDVNKPTPAQYDKLTPLMIACQQGHLPLVKFLVEFGDVKLELGDRRGRTATSHAVMNGQAHVVSFLLRLGVNHQTKDSSGNTLAHYAAAYGWYFNMKLLLEAGCDPTVGNLWKMTPLAIAFMKGHIGIVEMLVKHSGVDIDSPIDDATGMSLLLKTCASSSFTSSLIPKLKFLVEEHNASCSKTDMFKNSSLHYLAKFSLDVDDDEFKIKLKNFMEATSYLIEHGCDVNTPNDQGISAFSEAMFNGNYWIADKLLESGYKLQVETGVGQRTILHSFCNPAYKSFNLEKAILEKLSKVPQSLEALKTMASMYSEAKLTPLLTLFKSYSSVTEKDALKNLKGLVSFLVNKLEADVNAKEKVQEGKQSSSVLHVLCKASYAAEVLPIILVKNPKIDCLNEDNRTPLAALIATRLDNQSTNLLDIARALVKGGANVNFKSKSDGDLSILLLIGEKQPSLFQLIPDLITKGANIRDAHPVSKQTILHYMTSNSQAPLSVLKYAIHKAGANVNAQNSNGRTPLHLIVNSRGTETDVSYDIEDLLISAGADLTIKDIRGRLPLHYAFVKIGTPLAKKFLDPIELVMILGNAMKSNGNEDKISAPDNFGSTPLHYAALRGSTICCSYLMSHMKNIEPQDKKGNTPFGLAVWAGHEGCSLNFQQRGADFLTILNTMVKVEKQDENVDANGKGQKWIWEYVSAQKALEEKEQADNQKYPIFQEVVNKDWQGILYLMLESLKHTGVGVSAGISAAIKTQRLKLACKLVHRVRDTKELDQEKETLLHTLARYSRGTSSDCESVVAGLLEKGVKPTQLDYLGTHPIIYAVANQNNQLIRSLEEASGQNNIAMLAPDGFGRTPFAAILWNPKFADLDKYVQVWAQLLILSNPSCSPNILCQYPFTLTNHPGVRFLKLYEKEIGASCTKYTPLIVAVIHGKYSVVKWLLTSLKARLDVNAKDEEGRTALMHAVRLNDLRMLKLLLNPDTYNFEKDHKIWSMNYSSAWSGHNSRSATRFEFNTTDKRGWNVADYAVCPTSNENFTYANVEPILTILHKCGVPFNSPSGDRISPLSRAIKLRRQQIVRIMYKLLKTPASQQTAIASEFDNFPTIPDEPELSPSIRNFDEDAKLCVLAKVEEEKARSPKTDVLVSPDPLLNLDEDNSAVVMDSEQNIPFDCVLTKVEITYGLYGLYNFYKMQVAKQPKGKQLVLLFTQWGRVGDTGQYQKTPFESEEEAIKEFKKIFKAKSGNNWEDCKNFVPVPKRYRLVPKDYEKRKELHEIAVDFDKIESSAKKSPSSHLSPEVNDVMKQISFSHNVSSYRGMHYQNPKQLPLVSPESLKKGEVILQQIRTLLDKKQKMASDALVTEEAKTEVINQLVSLSEEYYIFVPVYGFATESLQPIFDHQSLREREAEIHSLIHVGFAKELLLASEWNCQRSNPLEYIYRCLGTKLKTLDNHEEIQMILQYIKNTSTQNVKVEGLFRVQRSQEHQLTLDNRALLWHGTKAENLLSILHGGLQIAPLGSTISGDLFGKGVYFSDMFEKSEHYASGGGGCKSKFLFLCEVALGKMYDIDLETAVSKAEERGDFLPKGFDSLKTSDSCYEPDPMTSILWKGRTVALGTKVEKYYPEGKYCGLDYNEYIVFKESQINLRYLVQYSD